MTPTVTAEAPTLEVALAALAPYTTHTPRCRAQLTDDQPGNTCICSLTPHQHKAEATAARLALAAPGDGHAATAALEAALVELAPNVQHLASCTLVTRRTPVALVERCSCGLSATLHRARVAIEAKRVA